MTFKDVVVKNIDSKSPYFYASRTMEIKMSEGTIITPTRAATLYEFNQKIHVPTEMPIENSISFSVRKMNLNKIAEFLRQNGAYKNLVKHIRDEEDKMKYSPLRAHLIQPTLTSSKDKTTEKEIPSGVDYLAENTSERHKFLRLIIKLQMDLGLDVIAIPYLKLPLSEYKATIKDITERLRNEKREPLFIFDLDYAKRGDKFSEAMDFFIKDAGVKLIGFPNRSYDQNAISYDTLSQYVSKDVAFVSFDVDREDTKNNDISKMHYLPFLGNDIYSIKSIKFIPDKDKPIKEATKESIKFFNPSNLLIEKSENRMQQPRKILQEMEESNNKWLSTIIDNYENIGRDQDKIKVFKAISRVHEIKTSTKEFTEVQKRVKSSESTEYIKEKKFLEGTLNKLQSSRKKK